MELKEILRFADERVCAKTGKHLDDLQEAILKEALQGRKYAKIAQDRDCTEGYVRVAAAELWKILSEALGEEVSKVNVRSKLERAKFYTNFSPTIGSENVTVNNNVNICSKKAPSSRKTTPSQETSTQLHIDLGDAPEIFSFYDRANELATLEHWIIQDHCHLVQLLGLHGIGKTSLAIRLIDKIKTDFDTIIYRSLRFSPTLETTLTNLLQIFSQSSEIPQEVRGNHGEIARTEILNHLRQNRCLIILDDVQTLFSSNQLAGQYKSDYEDYHRFFQLISEVSHNSCFLLISSEKPREIASLEKENYPCRSFILGSLGMASKEILRDYQLSDEEDWETLINTYQSHPFWLEMTASLIRDLFGGRVSELLQYELILDESLQSHLSQIFSRLTEPEVAVITQLAQETEAITLSKILNRLNLSPSDSINVTRSIGRRFLLETQEQGKTTLFTLNPVIAQYVKTKYSTS
jgi:NACHT domain